MNRFSLIRVCDGSGVPFASARCIWLPVQTPSRALALRDRSHGVALLRHGIAFDSNELRRKPADDPRLTLMTEVTVDHAAPSSWSM